MVWKPETSTWHRLFVVCLWFLNTFGQQCYSCYGRTRLVAKSFSLPSQQCHQRSEKSVLCFLKWRWPSNLANCNRINYCSKHVRREYRGEWWAAVRWLWRVSSHQYNWWKRPRDVCSRVNPSADVNSRQWTSRHPDTRRHRAKYDPTPRRTGYPAYDPRTYTRKQKFAQTSF